MIDDALIRRVRDEEIRDGLRAAIDKNILPVMLEKAYPGHFAITAQQESFGRDCTWPGLDSWQLAGAYLLLGQTRLVLDYFDFVEASQRADGNIPFAVFPEEDVRAPEKRATHLRGMRYPEDIFTYAPGRGYPERRWIGLFRHWVCEDPLSILGNVCYILTAQEIFDCTKDLNWLKRKLPSVARAAQHLAARIDQDGLISVTGGFYMELPPRKSRDGTAQCYAYKAFCDMEMLFRVVGDEEEAERFSLRARTLREAFRRLYWQEDRFAQYLSDEYGPVTWHGHTDVDWAALAFGLADDAQAHILWPALEQDTVFWWGGMPTQSETIQYSYRPGELGAPVPFAHNNGPLYDLSAMGRVWYLEMTACLRYQKYERMIEACRLVSRMGLRHGGYWHERYHLLQDKTVHPAGPVGYCEYPAVLARTVLKSPWVFL